ncbi:flagellar motor switch protein FliM [Oscillospiraceae bacterium OttesenSCG-928-F05]|nr:flagellar motor switch protein FliM [Oscillospiraceae bacterium OttesenSCG-928-F05]
MADVLSQSEIDELLNALNSGDPVIEEQKTPEQKVRDYDFRTANRFSKEQIRTLHLIFENFGRLLSTYLSGALRTVCDAEVISVEEQKYQEFTNSLPNPVLLAVLGLPPLTGNSMLEIPPDVAYSMISRLLGGSLKPKNSLEMNRDFTEIELVLLERVVRQIVHLLHDAWEKVIDIAPAVERVETNPQFVQIVAMNETIAIITLELTIGDVKGIINFCIPYLSIQSIAKQFHASLLFEGQSHEGERVSRADDIQQRIEKTALDVTAVFNETTTAFRDIASLALGDIIQLNHKAGDPVILKIGHLSKFYGTLGVKDDKLALKIVDIIREEEEEDGE